MTLPGMAPKISDTRRLPRSKEKERPKAAPPRPDRTNPVQPEVRASSGTHLPAMSHVRSVSDLTTVSHDATMNASIVEPLNKSLEAFITELK